MKEQRKPWTKAQIRRVCESVWAGGYAAFRSSRGWNVWLSGPGANPSRRRYFLPAQVVQSHPPRWLFNQLVRAMRQSLTQLEGARAISSAESRRLVRWCTRYAPRRSRVRRTARERERIRAIGRWLKKAFQVPTTTHGAGYLAERSRRGWVVHLSGNNGRLRGHYLVPFRALGPRGRVWSGAPFVAALKQSLGSIQGVQHTNDLRFQSPTWWMRGRGRRPSKAA
jgi:hypothetical protein